MKKLDRNDAIAGVGLAFLLGGIAHFSVAGAAIVFGAVAVAFAYVTAK